MITFDLAAAHPGWPSLIEPILADLADRYPQAPLRRVTVVSRPAGDRSMAATDDGTISLNAFWFARDPSHLRASATLPPLWHGPMTEEPRHVLTHEFGHCLSAALPDGWADRAQEMRLRATDAPARAPSPYALASADEFWAELFALNELGFADRDQRMALRYVASE